MFRTCTCVPLYVPLYLCIFAGGTYLGNLHIGQADKIQCQDLHVFFSLGELLVFWFILVDWKMIDPRDAGPWESFFFFIFFCCFFVVYVSKVLGRKKEGTF